jgi:hypothetical protein
MNRQQFFQWMRDPASLNTESLAELQLLVIDYPYFQTARLLYLLNLRLLGDYHFEQELRQVAAFAADRTKLREWMTIIEEHEKSDGHPVGKAGIQIQSGEIKPPDEQLRSIEEQIRASLAEIEQKKSHLLRLIEEKKALDGDIGYSPEEQAPLEKDLTFRPLPKDDLLEEFIREKQNQLQSRGHFYNPEESARKSIEENEGILSETLARLIAAQGKKDKAIKIYQQLMLKNPQKSSYFAAQIEKLRKEP